MTKLLDQALETVQRLSPEAQDEIARAMLHLANGAAAAEPVDATHLGAVLEGLAQARGGRFATEAEVEAAFRRFDQ